MDKKTISIVVEKFNDIYFKDIHRIIENNFKFIDDLDLYISKQNYFFTYKYLHYVYNNFIRIDKVFASSTLNKLKGDIGNLQELLELYEDVNDAHKEIFEEDFLPKSKLFTYMKRDLAELKEKNVSRIETQELEHHFRELKNIYFEIFEYDFEEQNRYVLKDLKEILNIKIFYFDRLLWNDAQESLLINRKLKKMNIKKGLESKMYLLEILELALPYSQNYKYFEKCLKVYK